MWALFNFCFIKFSHELIVRDVQTQHPVFRVPPQWVCECSLGPSLVGTRGLRQILAPQPYDVGTCSEHTHVHTCIALYID